MNTIQLSLQRLYESENNSNRVEKGECIWGNHLFSLLHLTELWKPSFAFHFIYTLFVWYMLACVCVCVIARGDTLKESTHVSTVLLWSLSSADNYSAPFSHLSLQMRSNVLHFGTSDNPFPWFHSFFPSTFIAPDLALNTPLSFFSLASSVGLGVRGQ